MSRLDILGITDKVNLVSFDFLDSYRLRDIVSEGQFDEVYNLAAHGYVGTSWDNACHVTEVNAKGSLPFLDAIKRTSPKTKFYQASTSDMFGLIKEPI